jgi:uncharacterized membrane protein SpoIIM required for sporulation
MDLERFVRERRDDWERLDRLLQQAGRGLGRLGKLDLQEMGALYRQASSDLARAQSAAADSHLVEYLTGLVVRGHGIIYRPEHARLEHLWAFLAREFPRLVRQEWRPILVAILVNIIPHLWCYVMAALDPEFVDAVAPPGMRERLNNGELWVYRINPIKPAASSWIMTNNISVGFTYFALGITLAREFWAFIAPHGALELPAVYIAGAAGLILGGALLFPGDLKRRDALVVRGRVAVKLILGCIPILVVAGIIEAFFSPLPPAVMPVKAKFLAGAALFALFTAYILRGGATAPRMTNDQ